MKRIPRAALTAISTATLASCAASPPVSESSSARLGGMQNRIAEREYEASESRHGLQAPNRAHGLRSYFDAEGVRIVERAAPESPQLLALRLRSVGRGNDLAAVEPGAVSHRAERVEIARKGVVEWYRNSPAGLEQGFTLRERPAGAGPLLLDIAVTSAAASPRGDALILRSEAGKRLHYGNLESFDATGRRFSSHFELRDDGFLIVVADVGSTYPLTIDPLLTASYDAELESNQNDANLGVSLASPGDVNGDGYADVIVGAYRYDAGQVDEGAAFVFHGGPGGIGDGNPLNADAQLESDQAGAQLGWAVASAGDVNGDGYADVITSARFYDAGENDEGAAFVFHGGPTGVGDGTPATADAQLEADQADALLGWSVASAGDVNGDGFDDVLVGARDYDAGQSDEGAAFLFLGSAAGVVGSDPASAHAWFESNQADAELGTSVASAGDLDADGFGDVVVGCPLYDASGKADQGVALVFYGSAAGIADGNPSNADFVSFSGQADARHGRSAAGAGDLNGDGYGDLVIGAFLYDDPGLIDAGAAFVLYGGPGVPTFAVRLGAGQAGAWFGNSVAAAGDVNGDGYGDLVVGAHRYNGGQFDEGAAFVHLGGPTLASNTAFARIEADQADTWMGYSVAGAGDVDGDGFEDVIVSAHRFDGPQTDEGQAFVYRGGATGIEDGNPLTADAQLEADQSLAQLGFSVASAGDVNGDGYSDVILGAPYYDAGESNEGAAFVFLGSASGIGDGAPSSVHAQLESDQVAAQFGISVASAGDVNGDGYADVIVGAQSYDTSQGEEGAAFVYHGGPAGIADGDPASADTRILGDQAAGVLGASVASAGDVNADGYSDVIVGSRLYDAGELDEGAAFVFHGSPAGIADGSPASADAVLESDQESAHFGVSVASAGDVNGDGYSDVIVGSHQYDAGEVDEGAAFVFHGGPGGIGDGNPVDADARLESDRANARLGFAVASAGDVNADGYADVIVNAVFYDAGESQEGVAFVVHGSATGIPDATPSTMDAQLEGDQAGAWLGYSVAGAGDVNSDGYADVIVGSLYYAAGQDFEGAAFVFLGSDVGITGYNPLTAAGQLEGDQAYANFGQSVASAGDVNGDGFADVLVGAQAYSAGQGGEGAAFVFQGNTGGRLVQPRQLRGDASGIPVQPWGATTDEVFAVSMEVTSPRGRELAKLLVEACPPGVPFGDFTCTGQRSASWVDLGTAGAGFTESIAGLAPGTLYRWRARALYAPLNGAEPPNPRGGPWRRIQAQAREGDVRVLPEPDGALGLIAALTALARTRRARRSFRRREA